jgi:DNA mismatch repair protein MLH1
MSVNFRKILQEFCFVGCVDNELALIQYKTGLYLSSTRILSKELFYQLSLFNFGNFGYFRFNEPIPVFDLIMIALDDPESQWEPDDGDKDYLAKRCSKLFLSKSGMLDDYFSIKIVQRNDTIYLETLPILIEDYEPDLFELPIFLLRLATEVDWKIEKDCFESLCNEISLFYSIKNSDNDLENNDGNKSKPSKKWIVEHVIYNSFRNFLLPSSSSEESIHKLVDLHDLYKVFER